MYYKANSTRGTGRYVFPIPTNRTLADIELTVEFHNERVIVYAKHPLDRYIWLQTNECPEHIVVYESIGGIVTMIHHMVPADLHTKNLFRLLHQLSLK